MTINSSLKEYIEREIIPLYLSFDKAHGTNHVRQVIEQSLKLAQWFDVNLDMVYTIAAYHDTGLRGGRERHHIVSAEILGSDSVIAEYFTTEQIETMCNAVEDHRASAKNDPRTIYGRIVAEADRCIEPKTVIRRTIQYGLSHYPSLSKEEHFARCKTHLNEKYGRDGYLKLWIDKSDNALRLEELRAITDNETQLRALFDELFAAELQP